MNKNARLNRIADQWLKRNDRGTSEPISGDFYAKRVKRITIPESGDPEHVVIREVRAADGTLLNEPSHAPHDRQEEWEGENSPSTYTSPMNRVTDERLLAPDPEEQLKMMQKQVEDLD